jgi:excisionase family DNA binding protein
VAEFLSVWPEAAEYLGVKSKSRAHALAAQGFIPTVRMGRRRLVPRRALEALTDAAIERSLATGDAAAVERWHAR